MTNAPNISDLRVHKALKAFHSKKPNFFSNLYFYNFASRVTEIFFLLFTCIQSSLIPRLLSSL